LEENKKITHLIIFTSCLFFSIIGYLTYFQIFQGADILQNPYNKRQWAREDNTIRGTIYDRQDVVLATTEVVEDKPIRKYPHNNTYSHILGYSYKQYGRSGIESYYNQDLMALNPDSPVSIIKEQFSSDMIRGNDLILTLDHRIQKTAEEALNGKVGSIVAIDPTTGEILALVSKPDFNPNTLIQDWETLVNNESSPLLNRSTNGLYTPGSIYKLIIASGVLENPANVNPDYNCTGSITIDGYTLTDYNDRGHGHLDLIESLVVSCNTNFARMAVDLGGEKVKEISKKFLMDRPINSDIPIKTSRFPYSASMGKTDIAAIGIGQGKVLVTPIHMALVAGTFANNGVMMEPYVVSTVQTPTGKVLQRNSGKENIILPTNIANGVKDMMVATVQRGTGKGAALGGITVGGKTGTAENATGKSHAWFIGFAENGSNKVAVAVILESSGETGGAAAAPIAGKIMQVALRR